MTGAAMHRLLYVPLGFFIFSGVSFSAEKIPASSKGKADSLAATKTKKSKETLSDKAIRASNIPQCEKRCEDGFKRCQEKAVSSIEQTQCRESKTRCQERCRRQYSQ